MIAEDLDAAGAGFRVGYEDASQFTREYKRLSGAADAGRPTVREATKAGAELSLVR